jgi:hypothetical protein
MILSNPKQWKLGFLPLMLPANERLTPVLSVTLQRAEYVGFEEVQFRARLTASSIEAGRGPCYRRISNCTHPNRRTLQALCRTTANTCAEEQQTR